MIPPLSNSGMVPPMLAVSGCASADEQETFLHAIRPSLLEFSTAPTALPQTLRPPKPPTPLLPLTVREHLWGSIGAAGGVITGVFVALGVGVGVGVPWNERQKEAYATNWCAQYPFAFTDPQHYSTCAQQWQDLNPAAPATVCNPEGLMECVTYDCPYGAAFYFTIFFTAGFLFFGSFALGGAGYLLGTAAARCVDARKRERGGMAIDLPPSSGVF